MVYLTLRMHLQLHLNEMLLLTNRHVMDKRIPFYVVNIERSPELPFWLCIIESEPKALHWINSDKVGVYGFFYLPDCYV